MEFERYGVRLDPKPVNAQAESIRGMSTFGLVANGSPAAMGELAYRIGLPVSVFIIALLAIPLSYVNPRLGRSVNIIIGVLIYFTYSNLNSVLRSWISQERLGFGVGVWITHALVLALAIYMFRRRMSVPRVSLGKLLAWLRGRGREKQA